MGCGLCPLNRGTLDLLSLGSPQVGLLTRSQPFRWFGKSKYQLDRRNSLLGILGI